MSGYLLKFKEKYSVKIGGRRYPVVKIGNQLWMAENLDYKFEGCVIGSTSSPSSPRGNYYNNDETTYGVNGNRYGLLYNKPAVDLLETNKATLLPDNWHVPSIDEINNLVNTVGGSSIAGEKLKSSTGWSEGNGTNEYGFSFFPAGYKSDSSYVLGTAGFLTSKTLIFVSGNPCFKYEMFTASDSTSEFYYDEAQISVRLVSFDYGKVTIGGRDYKTIKIGNQEWLAENLDFKFQYNGSTLPIGSSGTPSTPAAWYYNNDEATYGIDGTYKCGLLYNWYAAKYLDDNKSTLLPNGWHVPTLAEFDELAATVGGSESAGPKLKALDSSITSNWPSGWNGTDDYGFSGLPGGYYAGSFNLIGSYTRIGTVTESSTSGQTLGRTLGSSTRLGTFDSLKFEGFYLRLVKSLE